MAIPLNTPLNNLLACTDRVRRGPWDLIQQPGETLPSLSTGDGSMAFRGTRDSVLALADAAFDWVCEGACHLRLVSRNHDKTTLTLFSTDGRHRVDLVVWINRSAAESRARCRLSRALQVKWLSGPPRPHILSLMGCDGSGKTALAAHLLAHGAGVRAVIKGRHLYRESLFYKLAAYVIRPLVRQKPEDFDESLAPLIYLRACLGLQLRLWRPTRGLLLMDRSIMDFLTVDRKSDNPVFCRSQRLADLFGRRIPTIHLTLSYDRLAKRKLEMTQAGHDRYDRLMFLRFSRQTPTDYTLFNNNGTLAESAEALRRLVQTIAPAAV